MYTNNITTECVHLLLYTFSIYFTLLLKIVLVVEINFLNLESLNSKLFCLKIGKSVLHDTSVDIL